MKHEVEQTLSQRNVPTTQEIATDDVITGGDRRRWAAAKGKRIEYDAAHWNMIKGIGILFFAGLAMVLFMYHYSLIELWERDDDDMTPKSFKGR